MSFNQSLAKKQTGINYIGGINTSSKLKKNGKNGVYTYVVYLAPHTLSGNNVCPMATKECMAACLVGSGQAKLDYNRVMSARIKRTQLFFAARGYFTQWVIAEIESAQKKAIREGFEFSVRFNGTSDINLKTVKLDDGRNLLEIFPDVQFYDYTKVLKRYNLVKEYPNYHLTFSYSGANWDECEIALKNDMNVAVVFKNKPFPSQYKGFNVVDGDDSDLRYIDGKGVIVGLKYKLVKGHKDIDFENNKFIVNNVC